MYPDHELVQRCLNSEPPAQKQFYERFAPRMLGVCYRYVNNVHEAEDLLQEGFIRAFRYMKDFRGEGSLEGWLRRIMVTTALNFIKSQKRIRQELELNAGIHEIENVSDALDKMECEEVIALIGELSDGYRTVLNMFAIEGFSHKEIGDMLGIGESTSRSQYVRARQILIKKIKEQNETVITNEAGRKR